MKFYTNVQMIGKPVFGSCVENGKRYTQKDEFFPTLFVKSKKNTKYKTLSGEYVGAIKPGTVKDCREFYKKYEDVEGFEIYGNDRYIINTYQTNIQKMKSSLTSAKLNLLLLILKLRLSKGSLMLNRAWKRYLQSQSKTIQLSQLLLGELNHLIINKTMLLTTNVTPKENLLRSFIDYWMQDVSRCDHWLEHTII